MRTGFIGLFRHVLSGTTTMSSGVLPTRRGSEDSKTFIPCKERHQSDPQLGLGALPRRKVGRTFAGRYLTRSGSVESLRTPSDES